ncbi:acyltransferase [Alteromonas sp. W364]|uniref:acyltransferase n=1 Tax=Alteromonas sp. W364 TaxID=3075610 RepID=UPI0028851522|nr:acyltransferase [Alteromonas sp. W364]MDT0627739.1 acyltransferase [Alteromonas sp. W364]
MNRGNTLFYRFFLKECGAGTVIEFGCHIESPARVSVGKNVFIAKNTFINSENFVGELQIEDNVHIGADCHIDHTGNLLIKSCTLISEKVFIYTHTHGYDPRSAPRALDKKINEGVWLGSQSTILETAKEIASNTIVAANSVLTKDALVPKSIYAGVPAKKIKVYAD